MAFTPDPSVADRLLDHYNDADGMEVKVTLRIGTHAWNIPNHVEERAVQIRVTRDGRYDPVSSSILPVMFVSRIVDALLS